MVPSQRAGNPREQPSLRATVQSTFNLLLMSKYESTRGAGACSRGDPLLKLWSVRGEMKSRASRERGIRSMRAMLDWQLRGREVAGGGGGVRAGSCRRLLKDHGDG